MIEGCIKWQLLFRCSFSFSLSLFFPFSVSVIDPEVPVAATSALEEMALYSNKRKLRQGRRSLEAPVPT